MTIWPSKSPTPINDVVIDGDRVVIHTANMIPQDWTNMSQAVWRSPLLSLRQENSHADTDPSPAPIGSGHRFKHDLLAYLSVYRGQHGNFKVKDLVEQLKLYDFSQVRAALVASVPSKLHLQSTEPDEMLWGWPSLRRILRQVRCDQPHGRQGEGDSGDEDSTVTAPHIVIQISSIATLGKDDKYLRNTVFSALSATEPRSSTTAPKQSQSRNPKFSIIFPTAASIRNSLDGYASGSSIHLKIQSAAQQKQLQFLRRYLCHWSPQAVSRNDQTQSSSLTRQALRQRAAPHIKTYIRFTDSEKMDQIDWAMVTSANLSTQAWGAAVSGSGEVRIQSYEIGVLVWPDLFSQSEGSMEDTEGIIGKGRGDGTVRMVPTFGKDTPNSSAVGSETNIVVGMRMPYDLPLLRYSGSDVPWCATMEHTEPDWMGRIWGGYQER